MFLLSLFHRFGSHQVYSAFDDVVPFTKFLRENNIVVGVISNADDRYSDAILPMLGLDDEIDVFVISQELNKSKPDAAMFHAAAERAARVPVYRKVYGDAPILMQHVLHIGDSLVNDYQGAVNAGCHALLLDRFNTAEAAEWRSRGLPVYANLETVQTDIHTSIIARNDAQGTVSVSTPTHTPTQLVDVSAVDRQTLYTSCYCEENVYRLCQYARDQHIDLEDCYALFLTSKHKYIPFRHQGGRRLVCWDYHVVFVQYHPSTHTPYVFDFDTGLPFPCDATAYVHKSLPELWRDLQLDESVDNTHGFRLVSAANYLKTFASDRHHMLGEDGQYLKPPPPYPAIHTDTHTHNLDQFWDVSTYSFDTKQSFTRFAGAFKEDYAKKPSEHQASHARDIRLRAKQEDMGVVLRSVDLALLFNVPCPYKAPS